MSKVKTETDNSIISSAEPKKSSKLKTSTTSLSEDIIGSNIPKDEVKATETKPAERKFTVAIHSTKNVIWEGVGKVEKGYNIVKKAEADKWLTRNHVRLATPEEVAREYGA
jgi:hypothetical protein